MPTPNPDTLKSGTVTDVTAQVKNPDRVSVFIGGEFAFGLSRLVALEAGIQRGADLSVEEQRRLLENEEASRAKEYVINLVALQPRTRAEVVRKLREKNYSESASESSIEMLERQGLLDDRAFAEAFVRERASTKGHGPLRLRADLRKKGLGQELIESTIATLDEDALLEAARGHAVSRWEALADETDRRKRLKKTMDYVGRRGFSFEMIRDVCQDLE